MVDEYEQLLSADALGPGRVTAVIGYYVHHVGAGHLHRARAVAARSHATVTGLSSLPAPDGWAGPWLQLDRDDRGSDPVDPTAGGGLHWAPEHDAGLRRRMATLSAWIDRARPDASSPTSRSRSRCWPACTASPWCRSCCRGTGATGRTARRTP